MWVWVRDYVNRAHLDVPWRIGEKVKAMEIDRLHEDEVLSLSWIRLTRGTGISLANSFERIWVCRGELANSFGYQNTSALGVVIYWYGVLRLGCMWLRDDLRTSFIFVESTQANSFGYPNTSTLTCCCHCDLDLSKRPVTLQDHRDC
ncbi:hypothetical protein EMCRGX_G019073 [Ephydatia muelleri]